MKKKNRNKKIFIKYVLFIVVPIIAAISTLFYMEITVDSLRQGALNQAFNQAANNIKVFLGTIEQMKEWDPEQEDMYLKAIIARVELYDSVESINSLLVDENCNLVSERVITVPFCDPFTMPIDSQVMYDNVLNEESSGYYQLHCRDAEGVLRPCLWYYQRINLCGDTYFVLTGMQPFVAVHKIINVNKLYFPTFLFGLVIVVSLWTTVFYVTKNWGKELERK